MPLIDFDDIQAEENKRREAAVKAGASAVATKYEDSPLKQLIKDYVDEATPVDVAEKFKDVVQNQALPGFNFVAQSYANPSAEEIKKQNKEFAEQGKEEEKRAVEQQKEAKENELKVTRTSTGQPKVDASGNIVEPLQSDSDENPNPAAHPSEANTIKPGKDEQKPASDSSNSSEQNKVNPSPVGSGDARAAGASSTGTGGTGTGDKK